MKMYYGNTPVNSMKIKHYEMNTNDATLKASDLQSGITAYAKGRKVTGTGKTFEFAQYGVIQTNIPQFIPTLVNIVEISCINYPVKSLISLYDVNNINFGIEQVIGVVTVDNIEYPITITINGNILTFNCEKTVKLNFFYGKDNYV